ncbi:coenzyme F420-0:L-glutamate ligase, partial [Candidatus Bathyarchaeota archaeon]|nr:coenzyme F420-0:L-glutamate ligase [Candidatus Bathyarchaeota archaeon]
MEDNKQMRLYPVPTEIIKEEVNLADLVLKALKKQKLALKNNDILALTSKIVAYAEGRLVKLVDVEPSEKARKLAKRFLLQPEFAELILREADKIYGGVEKAVLTLKDNVLVANAGIDSKNAPEGYAVLWPKAPEQIARSVREEIQTRTGKRVAVMIIDSGLIPLRIGTVGLALAVSGFNPIRDHRGKVDIFKKTIKITRHAVADDLASAAHLLMGEAA